MLNVQSKSSSKELFVDTDRNDEKNTENSKSKQEAAAVASLRLTDHEAKLYRNDLSYICTCTWMRGDYQSAKIHLQERLELMIKKNPWLLGRIDPNLKQGSCHLTYSLQPDNENDYNDHETLNVVSTISCPISRQMPLSELNSTFRDSGLLIQNGPNEPLFKVSIIPCSESPNERFALLVQLSHIVGDGATYYKLLNMLCTSESTRRNMEEDNIIKLIPERIINSEKMQSQVLGKEESTLFSSVGNIIRAIRGVIASMISGKTTQVHYGWVNASQMKKMKEKAAKEAGISFVSTNDVITSWFMNQISCPTGVMSINLRGRLSGHTDLHVGNYENTMFYKKEDYATPALIRQSLTSFRRIVTGDEGFPPWWQVATSSMSIVTNWATFGKPIEVEGCTEDVHLPLFPSKNFPTTMPSLVIFRASAGQLGLAYVHGDGGANHLDNASFVEKDGN